MKINNQKIILSASLFYGLTSLAFAADKSAEITVKFKAPRPEFLTKIDLSKINVSCAGKDNAYYVSGSMPEIANQKLEIRVTGPFDGDKRDICEIGYPGVYGTTFYNKVYFALDGTVVDYTYNGQDRSCVINQSIGTSWDTLNREYNKLQSSPPIEDFRCADDNNDTYSVHPGSNWPSYDKGNITINIQD